MNQTHFDMGTTDIVYITAEAIVGVITVIGNSLVLTAIVKSRRLHTITNVFVGNLAIADIVVGLLVAPCAALSFMGIPRDFYGCVFINCLILMFTNVSILMLLSVAFERFLAIKEPFLYQRLLSVRRAIYVNMCVWVVGFLLGLMPMYGWHGGYRDVGYCRFTDVITYQYMVYFQFFGLVLLPLFIMLCIYIYILIIVRKHLRQTSALHNRFQQNGEASDGFHRDVRAAKMFALVIVMFAIFWFPVNIFNCVSLFCDNQCTFPNQAVLVAVVMSHANSSINPFLYATSNSRIKGAIKALFGVKLSPDERSSTDHNPMRPAANGSPSARENTVCPILHADHSSNIKDDSNPFVISRNGFRLDTAKLTSTQSTHNENEDYEITLYSSTRNATTHKAGYNANSQSPNNSLHRLQLVHSSCTKADHPPEQEEQTSHPSWTKVDLRPISDPHASHNVHSLAQRYTQISPVTSQDEAIRLSTTPPSSPSSYSLPLYSSTEVRHCCNCPFNVALANTESLDGMAKSNNHQPKCNILDGSHFPHSSKLEHTDSVELQHYLHTDSVELQHNLHTDSVELQHNLHTDSVELQHNLHTDSVELQHNLHTDSVELQHNVDHRHQDASRCSRQQLWCWDSSEHHVRNGRSSETDSPHLCKCPERNSSLGSSQILTVNGHNDNRSAETTLSSISNQSTVSSNRQMQVATISEQGGVVLSDRSNTQANGDHKPNSNSVLTSFILVDEYGLLTNDITEHTKL